MASKLLGIIPPGFTNQKLGLCLYIYIYTYGRPYPNANKVQSGANLVQSQRYHRRLANKVPPTKYSDVLAMAVPREDIMGTRG